MTNVTNDSVIFREQTSTKNPRLISSLYIIYILYIMMTKFAIIPEIPHALMMQLSFVIIVTNCWG